MIPDLVDGKSAGSSLRPPIPKPGIFGDLRLLSSEARLANDAASEALGHIRRLFEQKRLPRAPGPLIFGLAGAQGSGKSTIARRIVDELANGGTAAASISIDDFYLSRAERRRIAAAVHPLFVTRGPPGTHDIAGACALFDALSAGSGVMAPVFDKSCDDVSPRADWRAIPPGLDILIFEGWCVGAAAQADAALNEPINTLERIYDDKGVWRRAVNATLGEIYQPLFARLDVLIYLQPPSFEIVAQWRWQQEEALAKSNPRGASVMSKDEMSFFIQHYERITRWMAEDLPSRADLTLRLNEKRQVVGEFRP